MEMLHYLAALLTIVVGIAHSYLDERYIDKRVLNAVGMYQSGSSIALKGRERIL